jgi:hypothetical protein
MARGNLTRSRRVRGVGGIDGRGVPVSALEGKSPRGDMVWPIGRILRYILALVEEARGSSSPAADVEKRLPVRICDGDAGT